MNSFSYYFHVNYECVQNKLTDCHNSLLLSIDCNEGVLLSDIYLRISRFFRRTTRLEPDETSRVRVQLGS